MIVWAVASVAAAGLTVVAEDRAALLPGHSGSVVVAVTDGAGEPETVWPTVRVDGAQVVERERIRRGVWRLELAVEADAPQLRLAAGADVAVVPVGLPRPARFQVPARIDASTTDERVTVRVEGENLPHPAGLGVWVAEGEVVSVTRDGSALLVQLAIPNRPVSRIVPVAIRDLRHDEGAVWTRVHLRSRVPISIEAEPGASLTLTVSSRSYGPFLADEQGDIDAVIDQYPGESAAVGRIVDDLGNVSEANLLLGGRANAVLAFFAERDYVTGRPPPLAHLFASSPGGAPLSAAPRCRGERREMPPAPLATVPVSPGHWMVALPPSAVSVQVTCVAADATTVSALVPRARSVPRRLRLRVAPVDLRTDLPRAEVRAELEDGLGDPMPLEHVEVTARYGDIEVERRDVLLRAEYDGTRAVSEGGDLVIATYVAPPGRGPTHALQLGWGKVPTIGGGSMEVYARALDGRNRPLVGIPIRAEVAGVTGREISGNGGWARFVFEIRRGYDPIVLVARSGSRITQHVVHRAEEPSGGPGDGDLREVRQVRILPGRIAAINVDVEPSVLRSGPGATARVHVNLEDDAGRPIEDEEVTVRATEGTISELTRRPDGTWSARFVPNEDTHRRTVRITAATSSLRSSTQVVVESPAVRAAVGPWVGVNTNFGGQEDWAFGLDLDLLTRRLLAFRIAAQANRHQVVQGLEGVQVWVVPFSLSLLAREDRGPWAFWGGVGLAIGPNVYTFYQGGLPFDRGTQVVAGPIFHTGLSLRALGGELTANVRYVWLGPATPTGDIELDNVGGLAPGFGYRLVF